MSVAAGRLKVHDLSVSRDQGQHTHQIPFGNLALNKLGDPGQPIGREADSPGCNDIAVGSLKPRGQEREE